jgi:FtsZ-interacting cell division protein YlmF
MSQGFMNKFKHWVSGDPFEDELYEEQYEGRYYAERPETEAPAEMKRAKNSLKVIDHPSSSLSQVVVIEPRSFEDSVEIIDHLRNKKSVILNLHLLDAVQSQRVVDFLSGATYAIDGHQQRIGDGVFIFTPSNVVITADSEKGLALSEAYWNTSR